MSERPPARPDAASSSRPSGDQDPVAIPPLAVPESLIPDAATPTRRRWRLGQQTLTALLSSTLFVLLALAVAFVPVPYVSWSPGSTVDLAGDNGQGQARVRVEGLPTYPLNGSLRMTTVSVTRVDSNLGLLQALVSHVRPAHDVLPRDRIYQKGRPAAEVKAEEIRMMDDSKADAVVAALRAAGQPVAELPMVEAVNLSGPALNHLQPGDLVTKVDGVAVQTIEDVQEAVRKHAVGTPVVFVVDRAGKVQTVTVTTAGMPNNPKVPVVGITLGTGYRYAATVSYGINPNIVGPSAGVVFALAIYDLITPDDLLAGRQVAGTGSITPEGTVQPIGGIQEKINGAQRAGAEIFLVPAGNCQDLAGVQTSMELVKVATLRDAITGLQKLQASKDATGVPRC